MKKTQIQKTVGPFPIAFWIISNTAQKMKFSIKDFFSRCDQIRSFLRIWLQLLKKSLMENFILCAVKIPSIPPLHLVKQY